MTRVLVALVALAAWGFTGSPSAAQTTKPPAPRSGGAPAGARPEPAKPDAAKPAAPKPAAKSSGRGPGGSSSNAPVVIDADRMEAFKREGLVVFTGSVVAKQENSVQTADRMEVYLDDKGERVLRIVSTGNVKIVTEDCRTGTAKRAEYYDDDQRLLLIGDAKVWQEDNVVTGEEIEMFLADDRSTVRSGSQGRVKSVFYPKRDEEQKGADALPAADKGGQQATACR
jgi:lipopolysaccharide export system protein LptA